MNKEEVSQNKNANNKVDISYNFWLGGIAHFVLCLCGVLGINSCTHLALPNPKMPMAWGSRPPHSSQAKSPPFGELLAWLGTVEMFQTFQTTFCEAEYDWN
jgi:hypothetical protein